MRRGVAGRLRQATDRGIRWSAAWGGARGRALARCGPRERSPFVLANTGSPPFALANTRPRPCRRRSRWRTPGRARAAAVRAGEHPAAPVPPPFALANTRPRPCRRRSRWRTPGRAVRAGERRVVADLARSLHRPRAFAVMNVTAACCCRARILFTSANVRAAQHRYRQSAFAAANTPARPPAAEAHPPGRGGPPLGRGEHACPAPGRGSPALGRGGPPRGRDGPPLGRGEHPCPAPAATARPSAVAVRHSAATAGPGREARLIDARGTSV